MKLKRRLLSGALALALVAGSFFISSGPASAEDPLTYTPTQSDIDFAAGAPVDWAFDVTSVPLHNAILVKYPTIDTNADGYISNTEAGAWSGTTIELNGLGLVGNIKGIESFNRLTLLNLSNNQLTGEIPIGVENITPLMYLYLQTNQLSGEIPDAIGNLENLKSIGLHHNRLSGEIPSSLGLLTHLVELALYDNQLSGKIPESFVNLTNLSMFLISMNQLDINLIDKDDIYLSDHLTQEIMNLINLDFQNLPSLGVTQLQSNLDHAQSLLDLRTDAENKADDLFTTAGDNLATGITQTEITDAQTAVDLLPDGSTAKADLQAKIDLAQQMLDTTVHVDALLTPDGANRATGTTQADIDSAQTEVTALPDGTLKDALQAKIDLAQSLLDAEGLVGGLLVDNKTALASGVTQGAIDAAQTAVTALPDGTTKTSLQSDIDLAKQMLDAKTHVDALLTPDGANLGSGVTQGTIDHAQAEVTGLPDGVLKGELQAKIDTAQTLLDATKLVDGLLTDDKANLESGVTQDTINNAKTSVNALPDGNTKDALLADIDLAQKILDAKNGVYDLFDHTGKIKDVINQDTLSKLKESVNGLPDGATKNELLALIDEAQKQLNAKNTVDPTPVQPSERGTSIKSLENVDTGDSSNIMLYSIGLLLAVAGLSLVMRRKMIKR